LTENTLFIYTTDHGEPFPRAKCTLYDPGIKTSLIMSLPNSDLFNNGKVINQMISNIDLLPTILDYIGVEIPKNIEGESFLRCLNNQAEPFRKEIFTEKTFHEFYDPMRSIRTEKYKYIANFEKFPALYQIDLFTAPFKAGKHMAELIKKPRLDEELYDLESDPTEMNNLSSSSEYKSINENLRIRLYEWLKQTNDPILKGKIKDLRTDPPKTF
jgi:arylsulfatase A-like enzyme